MQVNISSITNGFLVMTPPKQPTVVYKNQQPPQEQPQPDVKFCADVEAIAIYLHEIL